jgi:hypothetical protein
MMPSRYVPPDRGSGTDSYRRPAQPRPRWHVVVEVVLLFGLAYGGLAWALPTGAQGPTSHPSPSIIVTTTFPCGPTLLPTLYC